MVANLQGFNFFKTDQKINIKLEDDKTISDLIDVLNDENKSIKALTEVILALNLKDVIIEGNKLILEKSQTKMDLQDFIAYSRL